MSSSQEIIALLRQGLLPSEIARVRGQAISTIIQHIHDQLGEGAIRPVEVILIFKGEQGNRLDALFNEHRAHTYRTFEKHAIALGFTDDEVRLYHEIRQSARLRGDIYVYTADIEVTLHGIIREVLVSHFGSDENGWWRQGVPTSVRKACVQAREDDPEPVPDPYCYTTLIHLSDIIETKWSIFQPVFSDQEKKQLLAWLRQLNYLRNAVMHPVKGKRWRPQELQALKALHDIVQRISSKRDT